MTAMRFDGRVAIVTGAGGNPGLGRSYAHLLAERGAKVVVNDLGTGPDGRGLLKARADLVAQEIVDAGGEAVADTNSVAERKTAEAIVQTALDTFGRVDILINNAGICTLADFDEISPRDIEQTVSVHLFGNIWMCRAVWPHFTDQQYGRIVNINSGTMFGHVPYVPVYGAAKGGILGLTRNLALAGWDDGIRVNTLGPGAGTAASRHLQVDSPTLTAMMEQMRPEQVAPAVAFLAHEDCPSSGKFLKAFGGRVYECVFSETKGFSSPDVTLEDVRDNWDAITSRDDLTPMSEPRPADGASAGGFIPKPYQPL